MTRWKGAVGEKRLLPCDLPTIFPKPVEYQHFKLKSPYSDLLSF